MKRPLTQLNKSLRKYVYIDSVRTESNTDSAVEYVAEGSNSSASHRGKVSADTSVRSTHRKLALCRPSRCRGTVNSPAVPPTSAPRRGAALCGAVRRYICRMRTRATICRAGARPSGVKPLPPPRQARQPGSQPARQRRQTARQRGRSTINNISA